MIHDIILFFNKADKMTETLNEYYQNDDITAIEAKFEAQKIAFAPYAFQTALALRNLGILQALHDSKSEGLSLAQLTVESGFSEYGISVLLEFGLSMEIIKLKPDSVETRYRLGRVGYFLLRDQMTRVNMDFMKDICYIGADRLEDSVRNGKPEGLKALGEWKTIYEGLSRLPDKPRESWFAFDHFYSDNAFPDALPKIFYRPINKIMDIGGNTAKWALACTEYDPDVEITIVDLPGQVDMALENIHRKGLQNRIHTYPQDVLLKDARFPEGHDVVWMSQFLDCFGISEITDILQKIRKSIDENCDVFILEPLWDQQMFKAAAYSLHATSLYFTAMANGNSKMYSSRDLVGAVQKAGFRLEDEVHTMGPNDYSLLRFRKDGK